MRGSDIQNYVVGVDIGGTHVSAGIVNARGKLLATARAGLSAEEGPRRAADKIADLVLSLIRRSDIGRARLAAVGVGSPGPLDRKSGTILETPNLKWYNFPLVELLKARLDMPVFLDNDAISATYGEWWAGAGRGARNLVGLTLGTGVGGGIIVHGRLYHGTSDLAGHFGHMIIEQNGRICSCGNRGCLEAYASATAIVKRALEDPERLRSSLIWKEARGDSSMISALSLYRCARRGDRLARDLFQEAGRYLGVGIVNIIHTLNPDKIIIGGAVANAGELIFRPMRREVARRAFKSALPFSRITRARLGELAGVIGAAGIALEEIKAQQAPEQL